MKAISPNSRMSVSVVSQKLSLRCTCLTVRCTNESLQWQRLSCAALTIHHSLRNRPGKMVTALTSISSCNTTTPDFKSPSTTIPCFFNPPFSGVVASPTRSPFIYRFMANKSEEHPMSLPNGEILGSFYSITGDYPSFQYTPGYEKIPDNWYKRNLVDYYTIPYLAEDSLAMGTTG
jgi:hypothetical protein